MKEPRRLMDQGTTAAERALLGSARADGPGEGAAQRMLTALAASAAGSGGPSSLGSGQGSSTPGLPSAAHAIKLGAVAKVGLVAALGVGALGTGVLLHRMAGERSAPAKMSGAQARAMPERPVPTPTALSIASEKPAPASGASTPRAPATELRREANPADESLGAEIRILDVAHKAVDAHNPAVAQRALDDYARRFPQGYLKPEASVLRLAVLVQRGNREAAKSLAAQLLASETYEAYQHRIRSLLREAEE